jgi:hypothetical protein
MVQNKSTYMGSFSTAAKYTINTWPQFAALITSYGSAEKKESAELLQHSATLADAFNGGFSFCVREVAGVLVTLEQVLAMIRTGKEDTDLLTPRLLKEFGCEKVQVTRLIPAKIEKTRRKVLGKVGALSEALSSLYATSCDAIAAGLKAQGIALNENEGRELAFLETRRGLAARLADLSLSGLAGNQVLSYHQYMHYKTSTVLKNALSRMGKGHQNNDVDKAMKALKPSFDAVKKEQQKLTAEHIEPIKKLLDEAIQVEQV